MCFFFEYIQHVSYHDNACFSIQVTLFDTAGMERFTYTIPPTYFRHAKVVLLVYSVDNIESLTDLEDWVTNFDAARIGDNSEIIRVLVGNKSDLTTSESIERLADGVAQKCEVPDDMKFVISAKSGDGFDDMFSAIAERVGNTSLTSKPRSTSIRVTESDNKDKKPLLSCCRKS